MDTFFIEPASTLQECRPGDEKPALPSSHAGFSIQLIRTC
jgi:hypothetical protein